MKLRDEILKEHSREQTGKIVQWAANNQDRFDELFELFIKDEYRVVQRASWPLSYCVLQNPGLIKKHFGRLIKNLDQPNLHNAVKRNTIRLLQAVTIPEKYQGSVMNTCFNYISSPDEAVAVKAFSLTVLDNLSKSYPEILPEIKLLIEERWNYETAAFKSRAKKILKKVLGMRYEI
ncbi:MAG: hypothetical protein ABIN89_03220 [Chitinophagaceae bacterium]